MLSGKMRRPLITAECRAARPLAPQGRSAFNASSTAQCTQRGNPALRLARRNLPHSIDSTDPTDPTDPARAAHSFAASSRARAALLHGRRNKPWRVHCGRQRGKPPSRLRSSSPRCRHCGIWPGEAAPERHTGPCTCSRIKVCRHAAVVCGRNSAGSRRGDSARCGPRPDLPP